MLGILRVARWPIVWTKTGGGCGPLLGVLMLSYTQFWKILTASPCEERKTRPLGRRSSQRMQKAPGEPVWDHAGAGCPGSSGSKLKQARESHGPLARRQTGIHTHKRRDLPGHTQPAAPRQEQVKPR